MLLPGGTSRTGSEQHYPKEAPVNRVTVGAFSMRATTVTNAAYPAFVEATGYRTVVERPLDPADFHGSPEENLVAGSLVFTMTGAGRPPPTSVNGEPGLLERAGALP